MIHSKLEHGFVILNELFTTATSYDAEIMGKANVVHKKQNVLLKILLNFERHLYVLSAA